MSVRSHSSMFRKIHTRMLYIGAYMICNRIGLKHMISSEPAAAAAAPSGPPKPMNAPPVLPAPADSAHSLVLVRPLRVLTILAKPQAVSQQRRNLIRDYQEDNRRLANTITEHMRRKHNLGEWYVSLSRPSAVQLPCWAVAGVNSAHPRFFQCMRPMQ
jgi:hypothetical protein